MTEEKPKRKRAPAKPKDDAPKTKPVQERTIKPAFDPEARERQLVKLAVDLAEQQLLAGTAAPSIINHYLKLATKREHLERDILQKQSELIGAKTTSITKEKENEELAKRAIEAMKSYNSGGK